ncbi:6-phosphogluconolactonase [Jiella sp. MQZ9-1]|uniref:6-phosphogluconolactonase n=1 Tax=Jiella flava TaxID=2816857 RepID=A0A939FZ18_9HYPH|nr:6-phosphogluconolactonase [Jiella flava]MBO0664107.1 6-phosphogluconolactonase [Jiella flava]MCD2472678.1 6-phosphogluconolactonase [Jiella flava]
MAEPTFHRYANREDLAEALATGVAAVLAGAIATSGAARLAVSGGSTPKRFFERLSAIGLDWQEVTITLVDERWVPEESARSNAAMLRRHLLQGPAAAAHFVPFYEPSARPEEVHETLEERFQRIGRRFDVVILGMGTDGHTASWFPNAPGLADCLDPKGDLSVGIVHPKDMDEPRVTLTFPMLADARLLALHIEGEEKLATFQAAQAAGSVEDMPVRAILRADRPEPLNIFWAP